MRLKRPLLIAELGLHGEGHLPYYLDIVGRIASGWRGWPNIAIKTQSWAAPFRPWASAIRKATGREPLLGLSSDDLERLQQYCTERGLLFGTTVHDTGVCLPERPLDFLKLGSFDATQPDLVEYVQSYGVPLVVSEGMTKGHGLYGPDVTQLWCVSRYPANLTPPYRASGVSLHSVPSLAKRHALQCAHHAWTIELHVTARPTTIFPRPADYCVSVGVTQFLEIAELIGEIWTQECGS